MIEVISTYYNEGFEDFEQYWTFTSKSPYPELVAFVSKYPNTTDPGTGGGTTDPGTGGGTTDLGTGGGTTDPGTGGGTTDPGTGGDMDNGSITNNPIYRDRIVYADADDTIYVYLDDKSNQPMLIREKDDIRFSIKEDLNKIKSYADETRDWVYECNKEILKVGS